MSSFSGSRGASITGTGTALPSRLVTNIDLEAMVGADAASHALDRYGIAQRYWCGAEESTADLAEEAARAALAAAQVDAHDVGLLLVATDTPEFVTPPTAAVVHGRLELEQAHALDVSAGGADFLTALELASAMVRSNPAIRHALVIGVSAMSKYLDTHDARTVPVYGDGAGAVVVSATDGDRVLAHASRTWGRHSHDVGVFAGGTRTPVTPVVLDAGLQNRLRVLREYPDTLPPEWAALVHTALTDAQVAPSQVTHWLLAHPSGRAIRACVEHVDGVPDVAPALQVLADHGYMGAATVPIALDTAARSGVLHEGDLLLLSCAGAGVSAAATVIRWQATTSA